MVTSTSRALRRWASQVTDLLGLTADPREAVSVSVMQLCDREDSISATGLSTAAVVAIVCNILVALLILVLILILCKACKVPSSQESVSVLTLENAHQRNEQRYEQRYLLTAWGEKMETECRLHFVLSATINRGLADMDWHELEVFLKHCFIDVYLVFIEACVIGEKCKNTLEWGVSWLSVGCWDCTWALLHCNTLPECFI